VPVERGKHATDLLGGALEKSGAGVKLRVEPLDVRCLMIESDV
jgi:hypothetical protein